MDYIYINGELYHHGVKGMKWGVRKKDYKAMSRQQKKATKKAFYDSPYGQETLRKVEKASRLGGPIVGAIVASYRIRKCSSIPQATIDKGKSVVEKTSSVKTESKRVADIKSRVTGKKEDGKPAFLMNQKEMEEFRARYDQNRERLHNKIKNTKDAATKERLWDQYDELENDYLNVVEQDFWYLDD